MIYEDVPLPITNGFYVSESLPLSHQECTNFYVVPASAPSLANEYLVGTPGLVQLAVGDIVKQNRGGRAMNGVPYFVNADTLYRLNQSPFTTTSLGTIGGSGRVSMAENGTQLMILVPGGAGYIYNRSSGLLVEITDVDFRANGNPQYVVFIDGYFCCTTDSKKFIISALNDGLSWAALDFGTAEANPDDTIAPIVYKNQLFIAGSKTMEAFQNIGGADFPFQRTGLYLDKGVYAPLSLINMQDSFMWIGGGENESPAVWSLAGNSTQKVSTNAIDNILQGLSQEELSQVYAWTYAQKGAYFVGFALPETTIVYDVAAQKWHERKSYLNESQLAYRVSCIVTAYGKVICADVYDGRYGEIDPDTYTEYGNRIVRRIATQPFQNVMKSIFFPSLELTLESGMGNSDCENPVVGLERSLDGKTWTDPRQRAIGETGRYKRRVIWKGNGRAERFETFRFSMSDPVKPVFIQLTARMAGGLK